MLSHCIVIAVVLLVFVILIHFQNRVAKIANKYPSLPLYDVLHQYNFATLKKYETVIIKYMDLYIYGVLLAFIISFVFYPSMEGRGNFIQGIVFLLTIALVRIISYSVTILPACDVRIKDHDPYNDKPWKTVYQLLTFKKLELGYKNDLLFSGHVSIILGVNMYIEEYTRIPDCVKYFLWLNLFVISILLPLYKKHYTIDILYAYITTIFLKQNFFN